MRPCSRSPASCRSIRPPSFTGTLRDYQRDALGWFAFLRKFGFGGCLADDMGLGKTVMVIALLEARRLARSRPRAKHVPSLAVLPRSLVFNWMEEARRFAPELTVLDATGASRDLSQVERFDLVLATYGTLRRDIAVLKDVEFDYLILDEVAGGEESRNGGGEVGPPAEGCGIGSR